MTSTKTVAQLSTVAPRWLLNLLSWVPVEAGFVRDQHAQKFPLRAISTPLDIPTRISGLYSSSHDQIAHQLRLPGAHGNGEGRCAVVRACRT
jgi:hypothetical protein